MKQASEVAKALAHPIESEKPADSLLQGELHDRRMAALWVRMSEIYGHRWTSSYGEEPNKAWVDGLRDSPNDDFVRAVEYLKDGGDEWPPNLPEFKALGREPVIPMAHRNFLPEPPPKQTPGVAEKYMAECRRILGR